MQKSYILLVGLVLLFAAILTVAEPEALGASLIVLVLAMAFVAFVRTYLSDPGFLTKLFLGALAARLLFGVLIYVLDARAFFGGDAMTYDYRGGLLLDYWMGELPGANPELFRATSTSGPGWGMTYIVAFIYLIFGKNFLAAQSFAAVIGAATAPLVYVCSNMVFSNTRVAKAAALCVAFFPAFIVWSGQLMKDGLIVFLLVLTMITVLRLQKSFNYAAVALLIFSLFGIISLRFYIFYMVAVAVAGSFIIGVTNTPASVIRRSAALLLLGVSLTYLGVIRNATHDFERYADLDRIQLSRLDQAESAESGFGEDIDVSTTSGAITAIPLGFIYLMLAPFPWEVRNLRQAITLPEVLVWWAMLPLLAWGLWYTIKNRLRTAFPILIFTAMLTLAYSIFQSNVGTAYRQRTQIQVFLFMFIAVGWVLFRERQEDKRLMARTRRQRLGTAIHHGAG